MAQFRTSLQSLGAIALMLALLCACAIQPPGRACADEPGGTETATTPFLLVVVGFAGDGDGGALGYDDSLDWHATIFESADSLATYYLDMSEGAFTFSPARESCEYGMGASRAITNSADRENDGIVHITLDRAYGNWGLVNEDEAVARQFGNVVMEAFDEAGRYVDYASFDSNGDRLISPDELAICFCVAGYDASPFENPARTDLPCIWPHSGYLPLVIEDDSDAIRLESYIAISEYLWDEGDPASGVRQEPLGILYHELGHCLGLPDLYPLDDRNGAWSAHRVGALSLMDSGSWAESPTGNLQSAPTALDAWSRYSLNWERPAIVTESGDYTVTSQYSEAGYQTLLIPSPDPNQYYLVENRQAEGHDAPLASAESGYSQRGGLVIWQVRKDAIRSYCRTNELNNTDHAPGIMPLFPTKTGTSFTGSWSTGTPDASMPFFDRRTCIEVLGIGSATIELPCYGDGDFADSPTARTGSGITVQFLDDSSREMTVHVEFASTRAGTGLNEYPLVDDDPARRHLGASALGRIACAALLDETAADVAIVDEASITAGLPKGDISLSQAESMLDDDCAALCFQLTGSQIAALIEESYGLSALDSAARALGVEEASIHGRILSFAGISYDIGTDESGIARVLSATIDGDDVVPEQRYCVVTTQSATRSHHLFAKGNRDLFVLWGSPADAIRSFVHQNGWESRAAELTGNQTARLPASLAPETASHPNVETIGAEPPAPLPAIGAFALFALVGGFAFAAATRR